MTTVEEVQESLERQIKRHETLKKIIQLLDELAEADEVGREWVLEQLADG